MGKKFIHCTEEIYSYFLEQCKIAGVGVVPGHHPDFKSKEHVDTWIKLMLKAFEDFFDDEEEDDEDDNEIKASLVLKSEGSTKLVLHKYRE